MRTMLHIVPILLCLMSCEEGLPPNGSCPQCANLPDDEFIFDIAFVSESIGWVTTLSDTVRVAHIYKTFDGGLSWLLVQDNVPSRFPTISFINISAGWVCLDSGRVMRTTDGGWSWDIQILPNSTFSVTSIYFNDEYNGWATTFGALGLTGYAEIYLTANSGETWVKRYSGNSGSLVSIVSSGGNVWAVGGGIIDQFDEPLALYSFDRGMNFNPSSTSDITGPLRKVEFINEREGFSGGLGGIFRSLDSGKTWSRISNVGLRDMATTEGAILRVVGSGSSFYQTAIYKSSNLGGDWITEWESSLDTTRLISKIFFLPNSIGWAAGLEYDSNRTNGKPIVMKYSNGFWSIITPN